MRLRGVAALGVSCSRERIGAAWIAGADRAIVDFLLNNGRYGVWLFFVISGFCIHLRWASRARAARRRRRDFVSFLEAAFRRLYPPYFVALSCSSLRLSIGLPPTSRSVIAGFVMHWCSIQNNVPRRVEQHQRSVLDAGDRRAAVSPVLRVSDDPQSGTDWTMTLMRRDGSAAGVVCPRVSACTAALGCGHPSSRRRRSPVDRLDSGCAQRGGVVWTRDTCRVPAATHGPRPCCCSSLRRARISNLCAARAAWREICCGC